ncbi:unnamed protein product [Withania somnifera]
MGSAASTIAAKLAFFPPEPSYEVDIDDETQKLKLLGVPRSEKGDVSILQTKRGHYIFAVFVRKKGATMTLLYSHGNAADLGQMFQFFVELSDRLRVNVMGYDYAGYGRSNGEEEDIILYGQSIGSGPTLELATKLPQIRGVITQSAILYGLRVMYRIKYSLRLDMYKNIDKIPYVSRPILVIHAVFILVSGVREDEIVDISHGKKLWELSKMKYEPLWVNGGNHCDLQLFPEFFTHLKKFITSLEKQSDSCRNVKLEESIIDLDYTLDDITKEVKCIPSIEEIEKSSRISTGQKEIISIRPSTDGRVWEPRISVDKREKPRKSMDYLGKSKTSTDQSEKGRNKSVALCNIDCLKRTLAKEED